MTALPIVEVIENAIGLPLQRHVYDYYVKETDYIGFIRKNHVHLVLKNYA